MNGSRYSFNTWLMSYIECSIGAGVHAILRS